MISLPELTRKIGDLPPLPDVVSRLLEMSRDPDVSLREMADLIKIEPALTAKTLRLCNSAYYGLPRKVSSIDESLVYLGTDTLVNFILAGCVASFYRQAQEGYGLVAGELWRHSVGCAIASAEVSKAGGDEANSEAFTAGLLHDIGKLVLHTYVSHHFEAIFERVRTDGTSFDQAERDVLGFSHTEVGGAIARAWNLPDGLVESIEHHPDPTLSRNYFRLVSQVHVGNILCISLGIGLGSDGLAYTFHPKALEAAGLQMPDIYPVTLAIHLEFAKAEELVGLVAN